MYEERLGGEFSTPHFQAQKAKACSVGSGPSGLMRMWNAAWVQCQEVRQRLEEMQKKKKGVDKNQIQRSTAANPQGEHREMEWEKKKSKVGVVESSLTSEPTSHGEVVDIPKSLRESTNGACLNKFSNEESNVLQFPETPIQNGKKTPACSQKGDDHTESTWRPREHHSEADLRSVSSTKGGEDFLLHQPLGRSLSEGSYMSSHLTSLSGFSPLYVSHKHCQSRTQSLEQNLQPIQNLPVSHNEGGMQGNLSSQSKRDSNEQEGEGPEDVKTPETLLTSTENNGSNVL